MSSAEVVEEEANAEEVEEVAQAAQAIHDFCSQQENQDYISDEFRQLDEIFDRDKRFEKPAVLHLVYFLSHTTFALNLIGRLQDDLNSASLSESKRAQVQALLSKYATRC
jgi:hypothetical protein